jgi:hypothetical protein
MDLSEINKRNEAIADFMGYKYFPWNSPEHQLKGLGGYWAKKNASIHNPKLNILSTSKNKLEYHSNWSWIMSVVEKIESLDNGRYEIVIGKMDVIIYDWKETPEKNIVQVDKYEDETRLELLFEAVSDLCLELNP